VWPPAFILARILHMVRDRRRNHKKTPGAVRLQDYMATPATSGGTKSHVMPL